MKTENTQQIIDLVKANASSFLESVQNMAGDGWDLLVAKTFWVDGVVGVLVFFIGMVLFGFIFHRGVKMGDSDFAVPAVIFGGLLFALCFFLFIASIPPLFVPEYYAIIELIKLAK